MAKQGKPRKRRARGRSANGALADVRRVREAAKTAIGNLRKEIRLTEAKLEQLISEEKSFREDLFGATSVPARSRPTSPRGPRRRKARAAGSSRRGTPKAERYFQKLPKSFTIDDVRRLAGRAAGISLAQWSRSKRIRKVGGKYVKTR